MERRLLDCDRTAENFQNSRIGVEKLLRRLHAKLNVEMTGLGWPRDERSVFRLKKCIEIASSRRPAVRGQMAIFSF